MKLASIVVAGVLALALPAVAHQATTPVPIAVAPAGATAVADLMKPPANARRWTILSSAGPHGEEAMWTLPDGTRASRMSILLRGLRYEIDQTLKFGPDGNPVAQTVRGFTPNGNAAESFDVAGGRATWKSQVDAGSAAAATPAYYLSQAGTADANGALVEAVLATRDKRLALWPSGEARAERVAAITLRDKDGTRGPGALLWLITGISNSPIPVWTDNGNRFFASIGGIAWLPKGYEHTLERLTKLQDEAIAARSPAIARQFLIRPTAPIAFTDVRIFDSIARRFVAGQTVVVDGGRIAAVGPAASTPVPANARRIAGAGHTLVPGLWDAHMHFGDDYTGPLLLSLGVTSIRDPGNENALTIARRDRRARGELLSPHVHASVLIDRKGPYAAQSGVAIDSQAELVAAVAKAKADGFSGVKFYGSIDPAWIPAAAAEAHRLGLHVHGHVPAGMRPSQAVAAGYDEITHINMVMMEAMPDSVVNRSNTNQRFLGPGTFAAGVDLDAAPIRALIATMAEKKTVVDPTVAVFEGGFVPENGDLSPSYAAYVGTLPPTVERGFRSGGFSPPEGVTRATFRASYAKLLGLVRALNTAGVPIVAGTDGSGIEIVRELELYVAAGMSPADALASATIAPARLVGADATTGSITVGKAADLSLVEGDPSANIGDLRNTRTVMMDGIAMDADALRTVAGFTGRPRMAVPR